MRRIDLSAREQDFLLRQQRERVASGYFNMTPRPASPARRAKVRARMAATAKPVGPLQELQALIDMAQALDDHWPW